MLQMFMNFTSMSVNFMLGLSAGTPTVAVPQLRQQANSTAAVSEDMASWISEYFSKALYTKMAKKPYYKALHRKTSSSNHIFLILCNLTPQNSYYILPSVFYLFC